MRVALGDSPQVLRDLSVSLDTVGNAESQAGRDDAALTVYRESLALRRQLRVALGDSPQVLDDLAVSLERTAGIAVLPAKDRRKAIGEAIALRQQLVAAFPDAARWQQRLEVARRLAAVLPENADATSAS